MTWRTVPDPPPDPTGVVELGTVTVTTPGTYTYTIEGGCIVNPHATADSHAPLIAAPVRSSQPGVDAFRFDPAVGDDEIAAWDASLHPQADT